MKRNGKKWSAEEDAIIRARYPQSGPDFIWVELGRSRNSIIQRASQLAALYGSGHRGNPTPSIAQYRAMLREECDAADVDFADAVTKCREGRVVRARWRVWAKLREMKYSLPGIGSAANRDHSTILNGLKRLKELEDRPPIKQLLITRRAVFTRNVIAPLIRAVGMR